MRFNVVVLGDGLCLQEGQLFVKPDFHATVSFLCLYGNDVVEGGCSVCVLWGSCFL